MYLFETFNQITQSFFRYNTAQKKNITIFFKSPFPGNSICLSLNRTINSIWNQPCFPSVLFLKIFLFSFIQNNDFIRKTDCTPLSHIDKFRCQAIFPFFTGPVDPMNGTDYSLSKKFGQPAEKRWSLRMDMYHIIISECCSKRCEKRCCQRRKALFLYGKNVTDIDSFILMYCFFIELCTTDMMTLLLKQVT